MKKLAAWVGGALVFVAIAIAVWRWQASKATPELAFKTASVARQRIVARVTASGTLQARVTVQVGSQVSGRIATLNADFNSRVRKGEIIAKIDPQLFVAAVEREHANWIAAKAGLVKAKAQERDAQLVADRTRALSKQGLASAQDLQFAETAVTVATAQTDVAKAALEQQVAALHQAQVNLSYTDILAPIDGVVISRNVDVGQTVASSLQAPVLFLLAEDLKKMQVHTSIAEGDVGRLVDGMETWFTVDAYPGQRFKGRIVQIRNSPTTVQNVVTYDAVIDVDNDDLRLRPGMTAATTVIYAERDHVLALPNAALRFRLPSELAEARRPKPPGEKGGERADSERTVYVLRSGRPETVSVRVGLSDGSLTEVLSGELKEGDAVIVDASAPGKPSSSAGSAPPSGGGAPRGMGRMF